MNAHNEQHDPASAVVKQNLTTQPAAAQEAVAIEVPNGAIFNGNAYADRLETYGFECEAGPLTNCNDWVEFRRCFNHLADWAYSLPPIYAAPVAAALGIDLAALRARVVSAIERITSGTGQMRVPADLTDPDLVLADVLALLDTLDPQLPSVPRPMHTAPRDGTVVRLLVQFEEHLIEDTDEPAWTIGACNDDLVQEDERIGWQVAGWCWEHDHFTEGKGTPVGWLPMLDIPKGGSEARDAVLAELVEAISAFKGKRGAFMALGAQDERTVRLWWALANAQAGDAEVQP